MDKRELGRRLRGMRAAQGRTAASVAADAGLSVPYVANLENGRGNPTVDALQRIAVALGARITVEFAAEDHDGTAETTTVDSAPLPAGLTRLSRTPRFRRDVAAIAEAAGAEEDALAARLLAALARLGELTGGEPVEADWLRLLDALLLVSLHSAGR